MCEFCKERDCTLTKDEVIKRGPIIENNATGIMRLAYKDVPLTYYFKGVPAYYSYSALIPDEGDADPHAYMRFIYDEDEDCGMDWEYNDVSEPLSYQTEKEFLAKLNRNKSMSEGKM